MAIYADLFVDQGSYFTTTVEVSTLGVFGVDLSEYSARGTIKKAYSSSSFISFDIDIPLPENGQVEISLSSDVTASMKPGRYVYDVEIIETATNKVTRVVEGQLEVMPGVSSAINTPTIDTVTADYTLKSTDYTILCDATGDPFEITVPAASTVGFNEKIFIIKKTDSSTNAITLLTTVDDIVNPILDEQWQIIRIQSNGSQWFSV